MTDAITIFSNATIRAVGLIADSKGVKSQLIDVDAVTETIRQVLKDNVERIMAEWSDAVESHLSEAWLRELMNVQANELAIEVLKRMGL
jgi:hypothetical protein